MNEFDEQSIVGISTDKGPEDFISKYQFVKNSGATPLLLPSVNHIKNLDLYLSQCAVNSLWLNDEVFHYHSDQIFTFTTPSTLFFSSGSTSNPKVIIHSDKNLELSAKESLEEIGTNDIKSIITALPLWHVGGLLNYYRSAHLGSDLILTKNAELIEKLQNSQSSLIVLVPSQLEQLIDNLPDSVSLSNQIFYLGGASISHRLLDKCDKNKLNIIASYGMTETVGAIATGTRELKKFKNVSIKINKDNRLLVKTNRNATHYIINNELKPIVTIDGYLETSDLAKYSGERFIIEGRIDQVFISAGENISPAMLESLITKVDSSISQVKIIPKEHELLQNEIIAFISPYSEHLAKQIKDKLPHTHRPHHILSWPQTKGIKPSLNDFQKMVPHD